MIIHFTIGLFANVFLKRKAWDSNPHSLSGTEGDDLVVEDLYPPEASTESDADRAREIALAEPALVHRLVHIDERTTGIDNWRVEITTVPAPSAGAFLVLALACALRRGSRRG